jgi:hypothetical protein
LGTGPRNSDGQIRFKRTGTVADKEAREREQLKGRAGRRERMREWERRGVDGHTKETPKGGKVRVGLERREGFDQSARRRREGVSVKKSESESEWEEDEKVRKGKMKKQAGFGCLCRCFFSLCCWGRRGGRGRKRGGKRGEKPGKSKLQQIITTRVIEQKKIIK